MLRQHPPVPLSVHASSSQEDFVSSWTQPSGSLQWLAAKPFTSWPPGPRTPLTAYDRSSHHLRVGLKAFPPSEWPQWHESDERVGAKLKLYVYQLHPMFNSAVLGEWAERLQRHNSYGNESYCLIRRCNFDYNSRQHNLRQYTAEVPILLRLLQVCTLVTDPSLADAFLVPSPLGTLFTMGWENGPRPPELKRMPTELGARLIYLNERTAQRHIFLYSTDSCFVYPFIPLMARATLLHLGDEQWIGSTFHKAGTKVTRTTRANHSITIPYRMVLPESLRDLGAWEVRAFSSARRPLLLFGAFGPRHEVRSELIRIVGSHPRVVLRPLAAGSDPSMLALQAAFCAVPGGDNPGLTQRFYFALIHGCLPVVIDPYERTPADERPGPTYPFASLIDWTRLVIEVPPTAMAFEALPNLLLQRESDAERARAYLATVWHFLLYDSHDADGRLKKPDAPSAVLHALTQRFSEAHGHRWHHEH
jgi:hypothetical protein